ncbi:MAG: glycosyltransferase family 9 protein [Candidatus Aminicenantes bacterium]|nr:MAG: glycosyltransferase family 9 protein [Candidatus Aminicenantes bacterium]
MTTPSITALRTSFPNAHISYVVEKPYRELMEGNPHLDRVIVLPKDLSAKEFLRSIRKIRKEKYDVVLDFHGGPTASLMTLLSKAKMKVGYKIKYKNFIYHEKLPRSFTTGPIHSVESHLNLVKVLGVSIDATPQLYLPHTQKAEQEKVKKFIEENELEGKKSVILHISAGNEFRNWGVENLVEFTNLLSALSDVKIILIGTEEDQKVEREILEKSTASLLSLVGRINLRELRELISHSSLFVGPDSGPMHVAASTSTPIVAYFGPNLPAYNAPWQANASIIEKDLDCRPCKQRQCIYDDFRCLRNIRPEEVYEACLRFIKN